MFLNFLKEFFLKRKLKNCFANVKNDASGNRIKTVGLLLDESYFPARENLVEVLVQHGILPEHINILAFRPAIRKNEVFDYPVFSMKDISWSGEIRGETVEKFTAQHFDLLISYYDVEKTALLLVTRLSAADFKTGFSSIDKRLNHLTITTVAENYKVFVEELFRYLKILNKI